MAINGHQVLLGTIDSGLTLAAMYLLLLSNRISFSWLLSFVFSAFKKHLHMGQVLYCTLSRYALAPRRACLPIHRTHTFLLYPLLWIPGSPKTHVVDTYRL